MTAADVPAFEQPVSRVMVSPVEQISIDADVSQAIAHLRSRRVSCLCVIGRDRQAAGVLSRRDVIRIGRHVALAHGRATLLEAPAACVGDVATFPVIGVAADAPLSAAARLMAQRRIHRVFVLDGGRAIGVVSTKEVMAAVLEARIPDAIGEYMTSPVITIEAGETLGRAVRLLEQRAIGGVVVTENGWPVGYFTEQEALVARREPVSAEVEHAMSQAMLCLPVATPLFRAAGFALATRARRILATDHRHALGVLTGLDFAAVVAGEPPPPPAAEAQLEP